jgi:hypothetical protein
MRPCIPRIYIAGAFVERESVARYMRSVEALGYHLTLDWTASTEAVAGMSDRDLTPEVAKRFANGDLNAIESCDVFWLMIPSGSYGKGAWVEFGAALSSPRCQVIVSGDVASSIFCRLADKTFDAHDAGLKWLEEVRSSRG